jgi:hypothetical protein
MTKSELLKWFTEEQQKWELLLVAIGQKRMAQPGLNGDWSMRDLVAHLTGWQQWLVARLKAARAEQPEPPPPWPADLQTEEAINAWLYETNRRREVRLVLADAHQVYEQMRAVIEALPGDVQVETIESKFHVVWVKDQRFAVGEFFHHFYDDHQADVHTWLSRLANE